MVGRVHNIRRETHRVTCVGKDSGCTKKLLVDGIYGQKLKINRECMMELMWIRFTT